MNVLVYAGPGTTTESVKHCIESLRFHLSPYYAVVTVGEKALLNDPWQFKTRALVIPGGADLPYVNTFNGHGNRVITDFVRKGGKYLGFCAGGYYASNRIEFEAGTSMEVSGPRELGFFPGVCKGTAYKGFVYNSHDGAKITRLVSNLPGPSAVYNYYNGGGVFVNALSYRDVEVLAKYTEPVEIDSQMKEELEAAVVYCKVGKGAAILTGTHPEFGASNDGILNDLAEFDNDRKLFMKSLLEKLGLQVNNDFQVPQLTPIHLSSALNPEKIISLTNTLKQNLDFVDNSFEDVNDTFYLHGEDEVVNTSEGTHLKIHTAGLPDGKETPYFNLHKYYGALDQLYKGNNVEGEFGRVIGYGEVVTSTNTLLDKNVRWLKHLPHGMVMTATTQVSGRGRGGNVWINPKGVMAQSVLFRIPAAKAKSIVTLQYVLGLAVIESIFSYGSLDNNGIGYEDLPVKLKWPNDIYALKPEYFTLLDNENPTTVDGTEEKFSKISGALVNSQYLDNQFNIVWGVGINVSNEAPTTSLNLILDKLNQIRQSKNLPPLPPFEHEILLAKIMYTVNQFYSVFEHSGISPFLLLYYKRWFHSHQIVTVTAHGTNRQCKIEGITTDHGLLVVRDTTTGETLELQPDGNSFDIFKGLVYQKS